MSRKSKIRWQESDLKELERRVRNFNAKINRIAKRNPELSSALPEKIKTKNLVNLISTRQDLNRELNALERFTKRGSEKILIKLDDGRFIDYEKYQKNPDRYNSQYKALTTKWQKNEITRRAAIINQRRKKKQEEMAQWGVKSRGEELGYTKGDIGMGNISKLNLDPLEAFTRGQTTKDIQMKFRAVLKESQNDFFDARAEAMRLNYLKGIKREYNVEDPDVQQIIKNIEDMDVHEFVETVETEMEASFEYASDAPNETEKGKYIKALKSVWIPNKKE